MVGKPWNLALVILTVHAVAACTEMTDTSSETSAPDAGTVDNAYPELVCRNESACDVGWNENEPGCRAYFDSCLGGLTAAQREQWVREIDECVRNEPTCEGFWACYQGVRGC